MRGSTTNSWPRLSKGKDKPEWQREYNRSTPGSAAPGERMFAQLKACSTFDQIRCDPHQVTQIAKAVQVLNDY